MVYFLRHYQFCYIRSPVKELSLQHKKNYMVIVDEAKAEYFMSKTELRNLLGISLKTFNKCLSGKTLRDKNIKICEIQLN